MIRFLPKIFIDYSSFWLGVLIAALLVYLYFRFRTKLSTLFSQYRDKVVNFRDQLSVASENDYVNVINKYIQGLHITSHLLPLDRIVIPPKCIPSPSAIFNGKDFVDLSLIQQTIGYDPLLPDLAVEYHTHTIDLFDAIQSDVNICVTGPPGSGKTVLFADCISRLLNIREEDLEGEIKIPFYTKAHHLLAQFPGQDLLTIVLNAIQTNQLFRVIPGFPKYLTSAVNSGRAILFIDDLDLLTYTDTNRIANFLIALNKNIPNLQLVVTATPSCLGYLVKAPLELLSIAPWSDEDKYTFLQKWSTHWPRVEVPDVSLVSDSTDIRNSMLVVSDNHSTPLEFVLKSWSAYAEDLSGPTPIDSILTYLKKCFPSNATNSIKTLETIALHNLEQEKSSFTRKDVSAWFNEITSSDSSELSDSKINALTPVLQTANEIGLIERDGSDGYYFSNTTIAGYLAARGLSKVSEGISKRILDQPSWALQAETMRFYSAFNTVEPLLTSIKADQSMQKNRLLLACNWLVYTDRSKPIEIELLKTITREIHLSTSYLTKIRLVYGLAKSGHPNTKSIFHHLMKSKNLDTRRAAALGSGLIKDLSAVPQLITQLNDTFPASTAACYALGKISSPRSLEAIAEALLHGNELLRRASAESLAQHRSEGHPALREGASREDLLVRYAVVHGLSLIQEEWAIEILDKMRIDEKEWVVRDLAQQVHDLLIEGTAYLPNTTPPPHLASWLHEFASKQEMPTPTPESSLEMLLQALERGSDEQIIASLIHLQSEGNPQIIPQIASLFTHSSPDIRQQALITAWACVPPNFIIEKPS